MRLKFSFLMAFTLPLDLSLWTETSFPFQSTPRFERSGPGLKVNTDDSAGGYALLAPRIHRRIHAHSELKFEWKVSRFPRVQPKIPLLKTEDDHPIRIGLLLDSDESDIPLPRGLKKLLKKENVRISRFVFFVPKAGITEVQCGVSPYSKRGLTCFAPSGKNWSRVKIRPFDHLKSWLKDIQAEKLKLTGFWIFADSDNSDSKTRAEIRSIEWSSLKK